MPASKITYRKRDRYQSICRSDTPLYVWETDKKGTWGAFKIVIAITVVFTAVAIVLSNSDLMATLASK